MVRRRRIDAPPSAVWDVLADGWSYPVFVVGAASVRSVDDRWPAVGTSLHHSLGAWPLLLHDATTVTACQPGSRLELLARCRPVGEAVVVLEVDGDRGDAPHDARTAPGGSLVTMSETTLRGPAALVPALAQQALLGARNAETLLRLERLVLGRPPSGPRGAGRP